MPGGLTSLYSNQPSEVFAMHIHTAGWIGNEPNGSGGGVLFSMRLAVRCAPSVTVAVHTGAVSAGSC